jgi:integrase
VRATPGKGGKERRVPLHPEVVERLEAWIETLGHEGEADALFRPVKSARGKGERVPAKSPGMVLQRLD